MELSFEIIERYFWCWLDFYRLGPHQLSKKIEDQPKSYSSPVEFLVASILISAISWTVAYSTLKNIPANVAAAKHLPRFTGNAQTAILQRGLFLVAMLFAATLPQMATLKWLLKSPATFKELLTGRLYASGALLVVFASLDALLFIPIVWITTNVTDEQAFIILLSWIIGEFLVFVAVATYYDIASVCAFTRLRKRRWLEAYCALALFFIGEEGVLAMVAFSILAVAYREPRFLIGVLVSALLILPFVFYAKLRLPKLRNLVQREYVSY